MRGPVRLLWYRRGCGFSIKRSRRRTGGRKRPDSGRVGFLTPCKNRTPPAGLPVPCMCWKSVLEVGPALGSPPPPAAPSLQVCPLCSAPTCGGGRVCYARCPGDLQLSSGTTAGSTPPTPAGRDCGKPSCDTFLLIPSKPLSTEPVDAWCSSPSVHSSLTHDSPLAATASTRTD